MKTRVRNISIIALLLISTSVYSQRVVKKANRAYDEGQYFAALGYYQQAIGKGILLDNEAKLKIGNCHYELKNYRAGLEFYNQVPEANMQKDNYYVYSRLLQSGGTYDKAKIFYAKAIGAGHTEKDAIKYYQDACQWAMNNPDDAAITVNRQPSPYSYAPVDNRGAFYDDLINISSINSRTKTVADKSSDYLNYIYSYFEDNSNPGTPQMLATSILYPYHDASITFTSDGVLLYFTYTEQNPITKKNVFKIFQASFTGSLWGNIIEMPFNSNDHSCIHPAISPNGETMFFASNDPDGFGGYDLYVVQKESDGEWSEAMNLGSAINTPSDELFPFLNTTGELFFASDGHPGYGGLDIFVANSKRDEWGNVTNLMKPINSGCDDYGFVVNPNDPKKAVFLSNRNSGVLYDYHFDVIPGKKFIPTQQATPPVVDVTTDPVVVKDPIVDNLSTNTTTSSDKKYRVQIMATSRAIDPDNAVFKGIDIIRYNKSNIYRYTTGEFYDTTAAKTYVQTLRGLGFKDAFVVSYDETFYDQRCDSDNSNSSFPEVGIMYRVQFKSSVVQISDMRSEPIMKLAGGITDIASYKYMGLYRYVIRDFRKKEDALAFLVEVKKLGYSDSFVAAFRDGKRALDIPIYK